MEEEESQLSVVDPLSYHSALLKSGLHSDGRPLNQFDEFTLQVGVVTSANGSCMLKQGNNTVMGVISAELCEPHYKSQDRGIVTLSVECSASAGMTALQQDWISLTQHQLYEMLNNDLLVCTKSLCLKKGQLCWKLSCSLVLLEVSASLLDACLSCLEVALKHTTIPDVTLNEDILDDQGESVGRKLKPVIDEKKRHPLQIREHLPVASTFLVTDFLQRLEGDEHAKVICQPNSEEIEQLQGGLCTVLTVGNPVQMMGLHAIPFKQIVPFSTSLIDNCFKLAKKRHSKVQQVFAQSLGDSS